MSNDTTTALDVLAEFKKPQHFENIITGIYGTFDTPAGVVSYLQTKARLKQDGTIYSNLTKAIVPAREALNISEMDFNQLLQRDLDDHRIATKLIEYVLNPPANSLPGFFPPVLAILLPFDTAQQPLDRFPEPEETIEQDRDYGGLCQCTTHGASYRSQIFLDAHTKEAHPLSLAVLRWNSSNAKLVIMDGQHRAMALLAIHRTLSKSWDQSPKGARYRPFYEHHVEACLAKAKRDGKDVSAAIASVELPVTVCWFPESKSKRVNPHRAARKLFVDVNNNAKPPSEARLTLLSDTRLTNIFARELLNRLRCEGSPWLKSFPLYGVEYDNPEKDATSPRRWSAVTSLDILRDAVIKTVFGPARIITEAQASSPGAPPTREMDARMRKLLKLDDLFTPEFKDGERLLKCDAIGDYEFPIEDASLHKKLLDAFYENFGRGILGLVCKLEPYKAHLLALRERYDSWQPADNNAILAKDALFEGVGMLWTIREGHEFWLSEKKAAKDANQPEPSQPDISRAWAILEDDQKLQFYKRRCELYLGSTSETDLKDAKWLYDSLITYAAQVGLMLAWVSLHAKAFSAKRNPADISDALAEAINATLNSNRTDAQNRRRILLRQSGVDGFKALNELPRLQPQFSTYYRYLWLELALAEPGRPILQAAGIDLAMADEFLSQCRKSYLSLLVDQRQRYRMQDTSIRAISDAKASKAEARKLAQEDIIESQAKAWKYWFGGTIEEARNKLQGWVEGAPAMPAETAAEVVSEDEESEEVEDPTRPTV